MTIRFNKFFLGLLLIIFYIINGCSPQPRYLSQRSETVSSSYDLAEYKDFTVLKTDFGIASFYGEKYHGRTTASGEKFDMYKVSAAHREYPFGTIARIINLKNNKQIILEINDRGPFIEGRIIDLSYAAAVELDFVRDGIIEVKIEILKWGSAK